MKLYIYIYLLIDCITAQLIIPADPFNIIKAEQRGFNQQSIIRPIFLQRNNEWSLTVRSELFYNNGAPNLENMGNRIIGKGSGLFSGVNFSYMGKFISFSIEPFYLNKQNKEFEDLKREEIFNYLNDNPNISNALHGTIGLRETQFYLNYNKYGVGLSNANMWWGPGLHTSLTMTNNTSGFPYIVIGTMQEKRYRNMGYNFRYIFSQLNKTDDNPFFTAIIGALTIHTEPIITIGFNRNMLSPSIFNDEKISKFDAATIFLQSSINNHKVLQTLATYVILELPVSGLKIFFELGTTDYWTDWADFLNYPDHGIGSIFGFRQYGLFNKKNLIMGFEYARLVQSSYWQKRSTINWYGNSLFEFSSYDGRRWAAHSGSDSDDLYLYFGFQSDKWSFIPALNYERHGVLYMRPAEVKMEIRLDFRYKWKNYLINIYFEREWLEHAGFIPDKWRIGNVIWFGIERNLNGIL